MPSPLRRYALPLALFIQTPWGCSTVAVSESPNRVSAAPPTLASAQANRPNTLVQAQSQLASARYEAAETSLKAIIAANDLSRAGAEISLAELLLTTGRRDMAYTLALKHCQASAPESLEACRIAGECLRRRGDVKEAIALVEPASKRPEARRLRLLLADLLGQYGLTSEARLHYQRLVKDFSEQRFDRSRARELALTGRAAHALGSFRDANEFFNLAEQTGVSDVETLLFRGELYLDAHDPNHAREVADEVLKYAPRNPDALLLFAKVRLAESRDTEAAERSVRAALAIDPTRADAYAVLAGLSLRDLDYAVTHRYIEQGLKTEPRHLDLLSLRAAAEFLADDIPAFNRTVSDVLGQNPDYARLFRVVAEYAEAEHRYDDTIPLLRRAIALNPNDYQVHAQLGVQLSRSGEATEGRRELLRAFTQDPFDLRVRNTLVLYDRIVDRNYESLVHSPFRILVPRRYGATLATLVPAWLMAAKRDYDKRYGALLQGTYDVELFAEQDSFGVRTSGVPTSFLQGVCFGKTIVARLPTDEPVNLGMTLYHELSHVYHLQLSKHRVPRWFTEGLAEFETKRARAEWSREEELSVYRAYRHQKIPKILEMNHAFSHASSLDDLAVAYVASTYLVEYLVQRFGFAKIPTLLRKWSEGIPTEQVLTSVLRTSMGQLDEGFQASLSARFSRLKAQYIPPTRKASVATLTDTLHKSPTDEVTAVALAEAELHLGHVERCRTILSSLTATPAHPDRLWVQSALGLAESKYAASLSALDQLIALGHGGYFIRLQRALVYQMMGAEADETRELLLATEQYPQETEPLYRLLALARNRQDRQAEISYLDALSSLEEADVSLHQRRVELNLELGRTKQASLAAETLSYVAPLRCDARLVLARAALARRDRRKAAQELTLARQLAESPQERGRVDSFAQAAGFAAE